MRLDVIDIIKAISILMIVNVHLLSGEFFRIGSTYHVIAFFFIVGLIANLQNKEQNHGCWQFVKNRAKRLLYPYYTLSLCYIVMHMVLNLFRGEELINVVIIDSLIKTITLRGIGTLWFLPVLFLAEILYFQTRKRINSIIPLIAGILTICISSFLYRHDFFSYNEITARVILIIYPVSIFLSSLIAMLFMYIGEFTSKIIPNLFIDPHSFSKKQMLVVLSTCLVSYVANAYLSNSYSGDLHKLNIENAFVYITCSVLGISFVTTLSILIARYISCLAKLLLFWGKNSLIIMTTHTEYYLNSIAYVLVTGVVGTLHITLENKMISLLSILIIMLIESGLIVVVNKTVLKYLYKLPEISNIQ